MVMRYDRLYGKDRSEHVYYDPNPRIKLVMNGSAGIGPLKSAKLNN